MALAICISCGSTKRRALGRCRHCGYSPIGDNLAMAKSLMLSTQWITDDGEPQVMADRTTAAQPPSRDDCAWKEKRLAFRCSGAPASTAPAAAPPAC